MPQLIKISTASEWLRQSELKGTSPATQRIAKSIAGRVRYLYELATGDAAFTDGFGTPLNPQGRIGVDHSGPPWGNAFHHPLWVQEGRTEGSSDVYGEKHVVSVPPSSTATIIARFIVRPHQVGPLVPYSRAYLAVIGRTGGGAPVAASVTFRLYDGPGVDAASRTATFTPAATGAISTALTGTVYTKIEPNRRRRPSPTEARWVTIERLIEISNTSANSVEILALSLNQIARRSH